MNVHHQAEILDCHFRERLVAKNAGIVHEDVHRAIGRDGLLDHVGNFVGLGDVRAMRHRLAACGRDLVHDRLRSGSGCALAIHAPAQIVDDDVAATRGQHQRVAAPQAIAGPRDDGGASVKPDHGSLPS